MLNSFLVAILIGALLGYLAGLGVGGGTLLILWLTTILQMNPLFARIINLLFFLSSAGAVTFLRYKRGTIPLESTLPALFGGCLSSAAVSLLSRGMDPHWLQKGFGVLLIAAGLRELFYRPRKFR